MRKLTRHWRPVTLEEITEAILYLRELNKAGPKTLFQRLDRAIGGVWTDGVAISGERGVGKSLLVNHALMHFVLGGHEVVKLDLENDRRKVLEMLFLIFANVSMAEGAPTKRELRDYPDYTANAGIMRAWHENARDRIWLVDSAYEMKLTPAHIDELVEERWRDLKPQEKQVILMVDSFDVLCNRFPLASSEYESQQHWLAEIQQVGTKYQIPIVLISHVGKSGPFKGTTAVQHFARTQLLLSKDKDEPEIVIVDILRSQYGEELSVRMRLDRERLSLKESVVTVP